MTVAELFEDYILVVKYLTRNGKIVGGLRLDNFMIVTYLI